MLSLSSVSRCSPPSFLSQKPRALRFLTVRSSSTRESNSNHNQSQRINYSGVKLEETVDSKSGKLRLDSWISSRISGISRARVQSSVKSGLVSVNGKVIDKVSHNVKAGDKVNCVISELQPLRAEPENIPLDIVYEDDNVLVVNKPAHMVVHPAPGNATGTLVNGILHHCSLPTVSSQEVLSDSEDISDDDDDEGLCPGSYVASVRPGIVHRLDKGTSGLLVVAKDEHSHAHLSEQFKLHTIKRVYVSLTCGVPRPMAGRVDVPIGRDVSNRIRMAAIVGPNRRQARHAASRYKVIEMLAGGGSALVEWRLETGRTHQIRAHAKYIGIPLLGDEVYGGTRNMALSLLRSRTQPSFHSQLSLSLSGLERPCLHALALGFTHPCTGKEIHFSCHPPPDFTEILSQLRDMGTEKNFFEQHWEKINWVSEQDDSVKKCASVQTRNGQVHGDGKVLLYSSPQNSLRPWYLGGHPQTLENQEENFASRTCFVVRILEIVFLKIRKKQHSNVNNKTFYGATYQKLQSDNGVGASPAANFPTPFESITTRILSRPPTSNLNAG
ncbi:unnamed protein product [Dovyalis caffra]|uniref:RNA pseudouridine synthase 2, chloroplastic n=1 Tax=Dovyalis caffra TaxID=77055 RepID=A0AAV1S7N1_9ROSI|nr:unnamed protein product [Dovyalis caffra]